MNMKKYDIPRSKGPFINMPLCRAGYDKDSGEERFWIATVNSNEGATGLLISENGKSRVFNLKAPVLYNAVYTGEDVLWLCGDLKSVIRFDLKTGKQEVFDTGIGYALVFNGMAYDETTKKLFFAGALTPPHATGISFDMSGGKTVKVYTGLSEKSLSMSRSWCNGDGTLTVVMRGDKTTVNCWNPLEETFTEKLSWVQEHENMVSEMTDENGRHYCSGKGWLNSLTYEIEEGPKPNITAFWFDRSGDVAYGKVENTDYTEIYKWNMVSGETKMMFSIPNETGTCLTEKKDALVSVTLYGEFYKYSTDGELIMTRWPDTSSAGRMDVVMGLGDKYILGTPFITQRFWLVDKESGVGFDAGKASPGRGEVMRGWFMNGKAYLASYSEGILTELDPNQNFNFPENPRVVAKPPMAMRPFCSADDGINLYYISNHHYYIPGSTATKYNTLTGETLHKKETMEGQSFRSLFYNKAKKILIGGTTFNLDCNYGSPISDKCYIALISPQTLNVTEYVEAPKGTDCATVLGQLDDTRYIVLFEKKNSWYNKALIAEVDITNLANSDFSKAAEVVYCEKSGDKPFSRDIFVPTDAYGIFAGIDDGSIDLWAYFSGRFSKIKHIGTHKGAYKISVQGNRMYIVTPKHIYEYENFTD